MNDRIKAEIARCYDDMDETAKRYFLLQARTLARTRPQKPMHKPPVLQLVSSGPIPSYGNGVRKIAGGAK